MTPETADHNQQISDYGVEIGMLSTARVAHEKQSACGVPQAAPAKAGSACC